MINIIIVCHYGGGSHLCHSVCVEVRGQFCGISSLSTFVWVLVIELLGLAASPWHTEPSCWPLHFIFWDRVSNLTWPVCSMYLPVPVSPVLGLWLHNTAPSFSHGYWWSKIRSSWLCGKHFNNWAISLAPFPYFKKWFLIVCVYACVRNKIQGPRTLSIPHREQSRWGQRGSNLARQILLLQKGAFCGQ